MRISIEPPATARLGCAIKLGANLKLRPVQHRTAYAAVVGMLRME